MIHARTSSPQDTRMLAGSLAELAQPGDLLLLVGDLGAGKTTFTQGFAAALGITEPVTSPTFTFAREFHGRLLLHHLDVYRMNHIDEALDLGLPELLDSGGVTLIEWGDVIRRVLPADYLEVALTFTDVASTDTASTYGSQVDDERVVTLTLVGPRWQARKPDLVTAIAQWQENTPC